MVTNLEEQGGAPGAVLGGEPARAPRHDDGLLNHTLGKETMRKAPTPRRHHDQLRTFVKPKHTETQR